MNLLQMTKCGRFGATNFDYSPQAIRHSVQQSLQRLQTSYLDTVYLHDIEFVCAAVAPAKTGKHGLALKEQAAEYGLAEGDEAKIRGEGDQKVLDAFAELVKMKEEGLIRNIGITGKVINVQRRPTLIKRFNCRLSRAHFVAYGSSHPTYSSVQAGGCHSILFQPHSSEHHICRFRSAFP